ncbi:hypothetical protein EV132_14010 [Rhizobium sullae]|uniref:Uncharacterized protein n=2 Tax=Rhizobium sullae TaxID=50338 RepID=A0A4V2V7T5_RHISU|nr:hypothetical protein EV132_14010 [Rhizobium sullae]
MSPKGVDPGEALGCVVQNDRMGTQTAFIRSVKCGICQSNSGFHCPRHGKAAAEDLPFDTISTSGLAEMNAAESQKSAAKQVVPCCFTIMVGSATIARVTPGEEPV